MDFLLSVVSGTHPLFQIRIRYKKGMLTYYYTKIRMSLRQFDQIIFEGVISLFIREYFTKTTVRATPPIQLSMHAYAEFIIYISLR